MPDTVAGQPDLFAHEAEYFIHTVDAASQKSEVITVLDDLSLGTNSDFTGDSSQRTVLFAESVTITGSFRANNIVLSANSVTPLAGALLDVSGPPQPPTQPVISGDGAAGSPGNPGGSLKVYVEIFPAAVSDLPSLLAGGGPGQPGQDTSKGTGGDGGKGGSGGAITLYMPSPYLHAIDLLNASLSNMHGLSAINAMADALAPFDQTTPLADGTTLADAVKSILVLGSQLFPDTSNPTQPVSDPGVAQKVVMDLAAKAGAIRQTFQTLTDSAVTTALGVFSSKAGTGGRGGSGSDASGLSDNNGPDPTDGTPLCLFHADTSALDPQAADDANLNEVLSLVNLTQTKMLLAKAKMLYMQADSVANPNALTATAELFQRLISRLAFVPSHTNADGTLTDPRLEPYRTIYRAATASFSGLAKGLDSYGHPVDYVPSLDLKVFTDALTTMVPAFQDIETVYNNYFIALQQQAQTLAQIALAKSGATAQKRQAGQNLSDIETRLENTAALIATYDSPIAVKKAVLDQVLDSTTSDIKSYYNFNFADGFNLFKDVMGAVSSCAFMPESEMMGAVQGATATGDLINSLIVQPTTTMTGDDGTTIQKSYMLRQIAAVKNTVDGLHESYTTLDDGELQPDDPGAAKLLMAESQFDQIMGDFKGELPDDIAAVEKAFQDYINTIVARNNLILQYNAYVNVWAATTAQLEAAQAALDQLNASTFNNLDPGLPDLVAMVSQMYSQTRDQIMQMFYQASRAMQFWSLSNTNFMAEALGVNTGGTQPTAITFDFISSVFQNSWINGLSNFGTNPTLFPADADEPGATIAYIDSATLDTFRAYGSVTVKMPLIRRPAQGGRAPSRLDPAWQNELLVDQANIRLGEMRVWLDGAKVVENGQEVDDILGIRIVHGGYSLFASQDDIPFRFSHDTVPKTFRYHTQRLDPNTKRLEVDMKAEFGAVDPTDPTYSKFYALPSPFTDWTITLVNDIAKPTTKGLIDALKAGFVQKGVMLQFGQHQYAVSGVVTAADGSTTVSVMLLGILVASFTVNGQTITGKDGKPVPEPTVLLPPTNGRQIDLSGLSAIRLEFTGTSYTFS
jgi:hypothetical protein